MPISDRDRLIALLEGLNDPDDAAALAAARSLSAMVKEEQLAWDDLILRADAAAEDDDGDGADDEAAPGDEAPGSEPAGDKAGDLAAIGRLLARPDLSEDTRSMLDDLKADVEDGSFSAGT